MLQAVPLVFAGVSSLTMVAQPLSQACPLRVSGSRRLLLLLLLLLLRLPTSGGPLCWLLLRQQNLVQRVHAV
jgi:hypothetical protein